MELLIWIQDTAFSIWLRESDWALFALLIVHTIGLAFLVGAAIAITLRIFGVASQVALAHFVRFVPVMQYGLLAAIASGVLLVVSYPAKALTNPIFYLKLVLLAAALVSLQSLLRRLLLELPVGGRTPAWAKLAAALCLLLWIGGLVAGKFLAYTHTELLVYR